MAHPYPLLSLALLAATSAAQLPAPTQYPMPPDVIASLDLRTGTIQELLLPQQGRARFEVRVSLGGVVHTLMLEPASIRSADFQLLVTDATGTYPVPAPEETTYSGSVAGVDGSVVAASLDRGELEAYVRIPSGNWYVQPLRSVLPVSPRELHAVYKSTDVVQTAATCGVAQAHDHDHRPGGGAGPAALQYCEIALDCDDAYYARNGSNVSATATAALSLLTFVNAIYQNDVEIRFVVTAIMVRTVPTYTSGPDLGCGAVSGLLQEFRNYWLANHGGVPRDLTHLLTGTGAFSGTVGCAFIGTVCTSSGYGASRAISGNNALNIGLVAHEIGHNWSAQHCDASPPCNIMCASLGGCAGVLNSFSAGEVAQILAHKASRTCLSQPTRQDPNPAVFYRLTNQFQGPGLSLDVINDGNNNRMIMAPTGLFTGQYWRFTPAPELPGTYRISCQWQGPNLPMDVINGGPDNNQPILAPIGAFTGQFWTLTDVPQAPGHVSLTTEFRGPNLALEGAGGATGNRPVLATFGPYTGQIWLLTPLFSADPAATASIGTGCRGRGGVPVLQAAGGTLPWINETLQLEVTNVPAGALPLLLIGSALPTPIDLGFLRSAGCLLRVNLDFQTSMAVASSRGTISLPIPNSLPLVGSRLPTQGAVVDPTPGPLDPLVAASNRLDLLFGLR